MSKITLMPINLNFLGQKKPISTKTQENLVGSLKTLTQDTVSFKGISGSKLNEKALVLLYMDQLEEFNNLRKENTFFKPNFNFVNLSNMNLKGINLKESFLEQASFKKSHLENANFYKAVLYDANLEGAFLNGADLRESDLKYANLTNADLEGVQLHGARYNSQTKFPENFDPEAHKMVEIIEEQTEQVE